MGGGGTYLENGTAPAEGGGTYLENGVHHAQFNQARNILFIF